MDLSQSLKSLSKTARAIRAENVQKIEDKARGRKKSEAKGKEPEKEATQNERPAGRSSTTDNKGADRKQAKQKDEAAFLTKKMELEAAHKAKATSSSNLGESVGVASKKPPQAAAGQRPGTAGKPPAKDERKPATQPAATETIQKATPVKTGSKTETQQKLVKFGETDAAESKVQSALKQTRETAQEDSIAKSVQQANTHERVWKKINDDISEAQEYDPK